MPEDTIVVHIDHQVKHDTYCNTDALISSAKKSISQDTSVVTDVVVDYLDHLAFKLYHYEITYIDEHNETHEGYFEDITTDMSPRHVIPRSVFGVTSPLDLLRIRISVSVSYIDDNFDDCDGTHSLPEPLIKVLV